MVIRICLFLFFACWALPAISQNCNVDFPGTAVRNFSSSCGGSPSGNLDLGENINMDDGDVFIFNAPSVINITGNLHLDAEGSGKIIIPAGVTVNVWGDFHLHAKNGGCTSANPCVFEIVVNGTLNLLDNLDNDIFTLIWSGPGTVNVDEDLKNSSNGCIGCGPSGCPTIQVDPWNCDDDGSGCSGGDFCAQINNPCSSDAMPPVINPTSNLVVSLTGPGCTQTVDWPEPIASDNCSLYSLEPSHPRNSAFPKGTTTVTYTAIDASGNTATRSFTVTVVDNIAPVITGCPKDITVSANTSCQAVVNWTAPTVTDNCLGVSLTPNREPGSTFNLGTTTVIYTAKDAAGNTSTCSFKVIVQDKSSPVFQNCVSDIVMNVNSNCSAIANWTLPTATDNCGGVTIAKSHSPGDSFPIGKTEVRYTAKDENGNSSICAFNVIVKNQILPTISNCPNDIILKGNEAGIATADWIIPTASTPCGEVTMTSSHQPGDFRAGTTKIEYKATDDAGNSAYCYFNVIVSEMEIEIDIGQLVTPDNNGMNDAWLVGNLEKFKDNKVVIVDRWGGLIFSATSYDNVNVAWRGTSPAGGLAPTGTYFYSIYVKSGQRILEKTGFIELIR